jgi:hypothetical protein
MRKIVISIIVGLLTIATLVFSIKGISIFNVKGIMSISEKNDEIESDIDNLSNIISVTYTTTASNLKRTASTLTETKTEYENQAILSNSNASSYASQRETYDIDYLWTKLGNYAKDENVVIKIEVTSNETSASLYNLNFSVTGDYVNITDFIYDIENDSKLGFKIDNFSMQMSENQLLATFTCKEISISVGQIENSTTETTNNTTSNTTGNTANTTNSSSSNTTNSTNTNS